MSDLETFLKLFPQFVDLSSEVEFRHYEFGALITREEEPINQLYFIVEGSAWVYQNQANGRAYLFQVYSPGGLIGDVEYFLHCPAICSVKATSSVQVGIITFDLLQLTCQDSSYLLKALAVGLAVKLRSHSFDAARNMSFPLINRLVYYLKAMNCKTVPRGKLEEIADLLGTTKRHLRRVISQLEEKGVVLRTHQGLNILEQEQIALLCSEIDPK